ncbi:aminotransferase [Sulfolobus sp. A20]|uniref:aminotransferase-like domain-containing protein n=1 Tax=Saccharolobus sp. A20 TaxID=1891280 RepID=UPI000845CF5F|nr:PLP-dependent aminotransferase family protein [Sulfolobus sp. A20]TRM74158.1 PLP-dependent aminotransferase family protein [Sulfolobus sp. E5]TRM87024.1 PLP-dependent aminotransferase family protein [Sulfolobus sp. C3]TRM99033.1 PLP-dependent aminotransferase family protein [Sulfolobus sp. E1]TRN03127.1 PLP-dependent aminotransferase family protein [Sulfolobus sp. F1]AOL16226.1 aminotransferase [Sulfolobus sp. A20]
MLEKFFSKETSYLRTSEIRDLLKLTEGRDVISLAGGLPDPQTFPVEEIKKIVNDILTNYYDRALQYSTTAGIFEFRKELVNLSRLRGISNISEKNIFVTVGSQEALFMLFNILVDPGDEVIVEAPTYLAALNVMRTRRPNFNSINVNDNGPDLDELEKKVREKVSDGKKIKLIYVIPTAQNPAGTTMNLDNRKRLLEIASKYDFLVVEDDAYGFLVFEGDSPPAIKALDKEGRVIYTGTFSKILTPGLRLGWVVAHEDVIRELELYKQNIDLHTPSLSQFIAMEAIRRGVIQNNLPKIRRIYKEKRNVMLEAIQEYFPKDARWSKPIGGMFVFAWLPEKIDTTKMLEKALQKGVAYVPGSSFYADYSGKNTMRLNFSYPSKEQLVEGIKRLGETIKQELNV